MLRLKLQPAKKILPLEKLSIDPISGDFEYFFLLHAISM